MVGVSMPLVCWIDEEETLTENMNSTPDFRSIINKNHGGEEPVVVAQRFLNIFRQLHIFTNEKKEEFNKMILGLPSEIRGMFSSLPGGTLLQEYVNNLEKDRGVVRAATTASVSQEPVKNQGDPKANILETVRAEAAAQDARPAPQVQPQQAAPQPMPSFVPPPPLQPAQAVPVVVPSISKEFAKDLARAFAEAMKSDSATASKEWFKQALMINEESRKNDTLAITNAIIESQANLAKMFVQHNTLNAPQANTNNANNIQIHTAAAALPPLDDLVGGIVKAQTELFAKMAKTQSREIAKILSMALRESHRLSTETVAEAMGQSKDISSVVSMVLEESNKQSKKTIAALEESNKQSQKNIVETIAKFQKENLDTFKKKKTSSFGAKDKDFDFDFELFDDEEDDDFEDTSFVDSNKKKNKSDKNKLDESLFSDEKKPAEKESIESFNEKISSTIDKFFKKNKPAVVEVETKEEVVVSPIETKKVDDANDDESWEWQNVDASNNMSGVATDVEVPSMIDDVEPIVEDAIVAEDDYVGATDAETPKPEASSEDNEWEWEYEELPDEKQGN